MAQRIFVTGGNAGIGLALCKQLAGDRGCHVYLAARDAQRGAAAVKEVEEYIQSKRGSGGVELITCDVTSDASVTAASTAVKTALGEHQLYAIVNNAGLGLTPGSTAAVTVDVNTLGPMRVTDAFLPLLQPGGRLVNVGSGAGPMYIANTENPLDVKKRLISWDVTEKELRELVSEPRLSQLTSDSNPLQFYGLSKAALTAYGMFLAQSDPRIAEKKILVATLTPGFIDTKLTAGFGATKKPEEGTVSLHKCLFDDVISGAFYGSDGGRSPLHFMRNPGEPEYDGAAVELA